MATQVAAIKPKSRLLTIWTPEGFCQLAVEICEKSRQGRKTAMAAEVMGMDAVSLDAQSNNAYAREDCEVCIVLLVMLGTRMDLTGIRSNAFMLMYGVAWVSLIWMCWTEVRRTEVMWLK